MATPESATRWIDSSKAGGSVPSHSRPSGSSASRYRIPSCPEASTSSSSHSEGGGPHTCSRRSVASSIARSQASRGSPGWIETKSIPSLSRTGRRASVSSAVRRMMAWVVEGGTPSRGAPQIDRPGPAR